jgi:branched-chain amino acid transport system permease protein
VRQARELDARRAAARGWVAIAAVVAAGVVLSFVVQERYHHRVLTLVFLWAAMGLAWNIISGYAGQISFGHQVFFGIGAYVTVLLVVKAGLSPWIGMIAAVAVAVVAAVLIGIPYLPAGRHLLRPGHARLSAHLPHRDGTGSATRKLPSR